MSPNSDGTTDTLNITRVFNAPRERVFAAFSRIEALKEWFGADHSNTLSGDVDFREGGKYHLKMRTAQEGDLELAGSYREIDPPAKLVFTWEWVGNEAMNIGESVVTLEFFDLGERTELRLNQAPFPAAEARDAHDSGWTRSFDKLDTVLASM